MDIKNLSRVADMSISQKKRERKQAISALQGNAKNIKTFAIFTAQNPDSEAKGSSYNKKTNKSLLQELKSAYYKFIPISGHFAGNKEDSYMVFNIPFEVAKNFAGKYHQTSFCFCDVSTSIVEYWEKEDVESPYDKLTNPYMKKDEVSYIEELQGQDDNYSLIGKNFQFTFPFPIFQEISDKVQEKIDAHFDGNARIVDYCLNHVGYSAYLRKRALYDFD